MCVGSVFRELVDRLIALIKLFSNVGNGIMEMFLCIQTMDKVSLLLSNCVSLVPVLTPRKRRLGNVVFRCYRSYCHKKGYRGGRLFKSQCLWSPLELVQLFFIVLLFGCCWCWFLSVRSVGRYAGTVDSNKNKYRS